MANLRNDCKTELYYKIECKPAGGYISNLLKLTDNGVKVFIGNAGYQFIECFDRGRHWRHARRFHVRSVPANLR